MSRVYFHSPSDTAELRGSERAWAASLIDSITLGLVEPSWGRDVDRLLELIPAGHYLHDGDRESAGWLLRFRSSLGAAWRVGDLRLTHGGHEFDAWSITLNTALAVGGEPLRFLARLHAQCEIHGWVDGPDRAWLAGVIDAGRASGMYRPGMGWEAVAELLRARDDEPVVMSYSVTESFPNPYGSDRMPPWPDGVPERWDALTEAQQLERDEAQEAWYELPADEQWTSSMTVLRASTGLLQLTPEGLAEHRIGHGITAFDLLATDRDERLAAAAAALTATDS